MKLFIKKMCAVFSGCAVLASFAGCSKDDEKKNNANSDFADAVGSMAQEDLPYGATITQLKPEYNENLKIGIEYDNRYLTEEQATKLSDYVAALSESDGELLSKTFYPPVLEHIIESSEKADADEYVAGIHDNIRDNYIGYDFKFDYILVENCLTESDPDSDTNFSSVDSTIIGYGGEELADKITDRKLVTFDIEYGIDGEEGSYMLSTSTSTSSTLYIYTIDGEIYIL